MNILKQSKILKVFPIVSLAVLFCITEASDGWTLQEQLVRSQNLASRIVPAVSNLEIELAQKLGSMVTELGIDSAQELASTLEVELGERYVTDTGHGARHSADLLGKAIHLAMAKDIVNEIDWDVLIATIALHDIFAYEKQDHAAKAAQFAGKFLEGKLDLKKIRKVQGGILLHDARDADSAMQRKRVGIEAQILFDVDQWDPLGDKGIYRYLEIYFKRKMDKEGKSAKKALNEIKDEVLPNAEKRFDDMTFPETVEAARKGFLEELKPFLEKLQEEKFEIDYRLGATGVAYFIRTYREHSPELIAQKAIDELNSMRSQ
ncbi:hypothetical protein ACFL3D_02490, partial [Candidatus Omnitrophota bacterium]